MVHCDLGAERAWEDQGDKNQVATAHQVFQCYYDTSEFQLALHTPHIRARSSWPAYRTLSKSPLYRMKLFKNVN